MQPSTSQSIGPRGCVRYANSPRAKGNASGSRNTCEPNSASGEAALAEEQQRGIQAVPVHLGTDGQADPAADFAHALQHIEAVRVIQSIGVDRGDPRTAVAAAPDTAFGSASAAKPAAYAASAGRRSRRNASSAGTGHEVGRRQDEAGQMQVDHQGERRTADGEPAIPGRYGRTGRTRAARSGRTAPARLAAHRRRPPTHATGIATHNDGAISAALRPPGVAGREDRDEDERREHCRHRHHRALVIALPRAAMAVSVGNHDRLQRPLDAERGVVPAHAGFRRRHPRRRGVIVGLGCRRSA